MTSKAPSNNDLQRAAGEGMVDERLGNANTQPGLSPVLRTDLSIETAVKDVLRVAPIDSDGIIVSVSGGEVTLKGDVRTAEMVATSDQGPEIDLCNCFRINYGRLKVPNNLISRSIDTAISEVRQMQAAGGRGIVELSCGGLRPGPPRPCPPTPPAHPRAP